MKQIIGNIHIPMGIRGTHRQWGRAIESLWGLPAKQENRCIARALPVFAGASAPTRCMVCSECLLLDQRQAPLHDRAYITLAPAEDDGADGAAIKQADILYIGTVLLLYRCWHQGHPDANRYQADGGLQFVGPLADTNAHAVVGEQRQHVVGIAGPGIGRVEDERFASQLGQTERAARRGWPLGSTATSGSSHSTCW